MRKLCTDDYIDILSPWDNYAILSLDLERATQQVIWCIVWLIISTQHLKLEKFSLTIFIDFKKSFDTIDFELLLRRLSDLGIRDNCLQWFISYLHERSMRVAINDNSSATHNQIVEFHKDLFWDHFDFQYMLIRFLICFVCMSSIC